MNAQIRIMNLSGAACFAVGIGAAWAGRQAASAPATQAAKDTGIMAVGIGCMSVPPARFVRWTSQDYLFQKADGMFQASY
jgi:hypothetical protein